jgi:O-glycosyl hydrolase
VRNPDGSFALVLTNPGEAKDLRVIQGGQQVSLALPRNAVATLVW